MMKSSKPSVVRYLVVNLLCLLSFFQTFPQTGKTVQAYYVSTTGSDQNSGMQASPFQTLQKAVNISANSPSDSIVIFMSAGNYPQKQTIVISNKNSKRSVSIVGLDDGALLTGGIELSSSTVKKLSDPSIIKRLGKSASDSVYEIDLNPSGIDSIGQINLNGFALRQLPSQGELFFNDQPLTLARWPNSGSLRIDEVIKTGVRQLHSPSVFSYNYSEPSKWQSFNDVWIAGIFGAGWAYDNVPVTSIDATKKQIQVNETPSYGIYSNADESSTIIRAAKTIRGYYFFNVLEELDTAGEYYIDRDTKKIYLDPPADITHARFVISNTVTPLVKIAGSYNISFKNINFGYSRASLLTMSNCTNINIDHCHFMNCGINAIEAGFSTNLLISNCRITGVGSSGIIITGGDRKQLVKANNVVLNTEISQFSRIHRSYNPAISISGVGTTVQSCNIHDGPDQAIIFNGNDHNIADNKIERVCTEFSDMGAVYTGRDPTSAGTVISNNYFHDIGNSNGILAGVYLDDGASGIQVSGNLFNTVGDVVGAIHINGGSDNVLTNNVFYNCPIGVSNTPMPNTTWKQTFYSAGSGQKKMMDTLFRQSSLYKTRYPFLAKLLDSTADNARSNLVQNSIFVNCGVQSRGKELTSTNAVSEPDNKVFIDAKNHDFRLSNLPGEVTQWKGWRSYDFNKMGK